MLTRCRAITLTVIAIGALAACTGGDSVAPPIGALSTPEASASHIASIPGMMGAPRIIQTNGGMKGCTARDPQFGAAVIGPNGGDLVVGPNRLIIPPGALTQTVQISGTAPEGTVPSIILEPHGLQFKKPAGLLLDASNCTDVPDVVYINELGVVSNPIPAIYSTWWHTIAAPIDHFSGYAVAF
jgi:hypothetical protein